MEMVSQSMDLVSRSVSAGVCVGSCSSVGRHNVFSSSRFDRNSHFVFTTFVASEPNRRLSGDSVRWDVRSPSWIWRQKKGQAVLTTMISRMGDYHKQTKTAELNPVSLLIEKRHNAFCDKLRRSRIFTFANWRSFAAKI